MPANTVVANIRQASCVCVSVEICVPTPGSCLYAKLKASMNEKASTPSAHPCQMPIVCGRKNAAATCKAPAINPERNDNRNVLGYRSCSRRPRTVSITMIQIHGYKRLPACKNAFFSKSVHIRPANIIQIFLPHMLPAPSNAVPKGAVPSRLQCPTKYAVTKSTIPEKNFVSFIFSIPSTGWHFH